MVEKETKTREELYYNVQDTFLHSGNSLKDLKSERKKYSKSQLEEIEEVCDSYDVKKSCESQLSKTTDHF